jgi:Uncharacterised nucleotidyltransferase
MWNLRIDAATGEVVSALRTNGVDSIVLKGATFSEWYPPDSGRMYADGDVWVAPGDVRAAEKVLRAIGFTAQFEGDQPTWWQEHANNWYREEDGGHIDLHRRLQGAELDPEQTWEILWPERTQFTVGGELAYRLPEHARALYAILHATFHDKDDPRGLPHLEAALAAVDDATWTEALALAGRLDAIDAFGAGLRLLPAGAALAERIGAPEPHSVHTLLWASAPPPLALGFDQLASARGMQRLLIILQKFVPPPGFIRHWWPPAARNPLMLAVGYVYRPLWLFRRAPAGYRAWRAARRAARSSS